MKHTGGLTGAQCRRRSLYILGIFVILGIAAGSVYAARGGNTASPWLNQCFLPGEYSRAAQIFTGTFLASVLFLIGAFTAGLSAAGQPIGVAMLVYRGFGIGASAAAVYISCGFDGLAAVVLLLLPKAVVSIVISVLAVRELIRSSNLLMRFIISGDADDDRHRDLRLYCIKFLVLTLISAFLALIDAAAGYFLAPLVL